MQSKTLELDRVRVVVTYEKSASPLNISITVAGMKSPGFGAMVYAVHSGKRTSVTTLRDVEGLGDSVKEIAMSLAQKFDRLVFVNSSVNGSIGLAKEISVHVQECLAAEENE